MPRRRRKRFRRRGGNTAHRALKLARANRGMIDGERKIFDTVGNAELTATTGDIWALSAIPQGVSSGNRIGTQVKAKSLMLRYAVKCQTDDDAVTRIVLFMYLDDDASDPTMHGVAQTDVLEYADPLSPMDYTNRKHFRVLHTQLFAGNPDGADHWVVKRYIKLNHALFLDGGNADSEKGGLWLGAFTDSAGGADTRPRLKFRTRLSFVDN